MDMNPNTFQLARVIHERRIEEALRRQRHQHAPATQVRLPTHLLTGLRQTLGNWLITFGMRLKTEQQSEFA